MSIMFKVTFFEMHFDHGKYFLKSLLGMLVNFGSVLMFVNVLF